MAGSALAAGPVFQPPGSNLTLGDVSHGQRVQSSSSNPAAAAADSARSPGNRGTVVSVAAGLEYGNLENIFELYDELTGGYTPSDPGGGDPGEDPDDGIDLGEIWDSLDPDVQEAVEAIATEVATQAALLAIIREQGFAKAWLAADVPVMIGTDRHGGAWRSGVSWSGTSKAFGLVESINFDEEAARQALQDWFDTLPINRPTLFPVSDQVLLSVNPATNAVVMAIRNDSSIVTKATQMFEFDLGYSREVWSGQSGKLYLGAEARLYQARLSRLSVRFGDVTDSKELFDAIRNSDFNTDTRMGVDIGALWVAGRYQLGATVTNLNEPRFRFPNVDISPYTNLDIIRFLEKETIYTRDRQLKLEASVFGAERGWGAHLGIDVDPATDALGDQFQWATVSAGFNTDSWWLPAGRISYRKNLAGTQQGYLGIGVTAFRYLNIDLASAFNTVRIDGRQLPEGLMASIGFHINW